MLSRPRLGRMRRIEPDTVSVILALWKSTAIPGLLYGAKVMPLNKGDIKILESQ